jgi:hypothetical protein
MSDPNWIPTANTRHPESVLSKTRTYFGVEASSRSTPFLRHRKQRSKRYPMSLQMTLGLTRDALLREATGPFWL